MNDNLEQLEIRASFSKITSFCKEKYKIYGCIGYSEKFWENYHAIKKASMQELELGQLDEKIQACIKSCVEKQDKRTLRLMAFTLFNGTRFKTFNTHTTLLKYLFANPKSFAIDIAKVMQSAFIVWKTSPLKEAISNINKGYDRGSIADNKKIDPNANTKIFFGGGLFFLQDFLNHENNGYAIEGDFTTGIYVSMDYNVRSGGYAYRAIIHNFDFPCSLTAEIFAEYLLAVRESKTFEKEAFLSEKSREHLSNTQIVEMKERDISFVELPMLPPSSLMKAYDANNENKTILLSVREIFEAQGLITFNGFDNLIPKDWITPQHEQATPALQF